jgi:putative NADH-flavin reductase
VAQALQKGYDVTAVVRNPDKLAIRDSKLTVSKYYLANNIINNLSYTMLNRQL